MEPRSGEKIVAQGARGCCATRESQLPSSAEEGKADAVAAAGVVLVKKIIILICTTLKAAPYRAWAPRPSARAKVASQLFLCRAASPARLRRGAAVRTLGNSPARPGFRQFSADSPRGATQSILCAKSRNRGSTQMNAHESCGRIVRTWLLVLVAAATGLAQQAGAPITIRAAQVFDGRGGVQRNVVVTVRGSKIERVAPAGGAVTSDLGT